MIFIVIFTATNLGALLHLYSDPPGARTRARVVEVFLLYYLAVQWGFGAALTSVPHIVAPDRVAEYIGWQPGSPFQVELGFASLGLALVGVLSIWLRGWYWVAPAVGRSVFLLGAAYVHIADIATRGNLAPGNAGPVLWADVLMPGIVLGLLAAHIRMGGMASEREWRLGRG